jgi:PKD domain
MNFFNFPIPRFRSVRSPLNPPLRARFVLVVVTLAALTISPLRGQTCPTIIALTFTDSEPAFDETSATVTFQWSAVTDFSCDGPCSYIVTGFTSSGYCTDPTTLTINDQVFNPPPTSSTLTYTASLSLADARYDFRVRVASLPDVPTCPEVFASWDSFEQPPAKPVLTATPMPAGAVTLRYSYPDERASVFLLVDRATAAAGPFETISSDAAAYCPPNSQNTFIDYGSGGSAAAGGMLAAGTYYYRIRAGNFGGGTHLSDVETDSDVVAVTVPSQTPPCPKASNPNLTVDNATVVVGQSYTLSWNSVFAQETGTYGIQLFNNSSGTFLTLPNASSSPATSFTTTAQPSDAGRTLTYRVRARPTCAGTDSSLYGVSNTVNVTVGCPVETTPQITSPGGGTFQPGQTYTLTWTAASPLPSQYVVQIQRGDLAPVPLPPTTSTSLTYTILPADPGTLSFIVQAQSACGAAGNSPLSDPVQILVGCNNSSPPSEPGNLKLADHNGGPVTGTSFLDLSWDAVPQPVSSYHWMLNGGQEGDVDGSVALPTAGANPVGETGAIHLSVKATNCSGDSPVAAKDAPNLPPVADFAFTVNGLMATFTDNSSPESSGMQPTSWLWLFGDSTPPDERQSPAPHPYATAGAYTVWLIASNGAGSSVKSQVVTVGFPSSAAVALDAVTRTFDISNRERQRLASVQIGRPGSQWLRVTTLEQAETIVFLRFLDASGALIKERRLSIEPGQDAQFDLGAYGLSGIYSLELVSMQRFEASVVESIPSRQPVELPRRHGSVRTEDRP